MNEQQLQNLLRQAAQKLNMREEDLLRCLQNKEDGAKLPQNPTLQRILQDPEAMRRMLESPQAKALMQMLTKKKET